MNQFAKLNRQYIGGAWHDGSSTKTVTDRNPYSGKSIADFKLASFSDLDEAYRSAAAAQNIWAEVNPVEKRTEHRARYGSVFDERRPSKASPTVKRSPVDDKTPLRA